MNRCKPDRNINGVQVVGGSNPLTPTKKINGLDIQCLGRFRLSHHRVTTRMNFGLFGAHHLPGSRPQKTRLGAGGKGGCKEAWPIVGVATPSRPGAGLGETSSLSDFARRARY
jgi:hypothetical protein